MWRKKERPWCSGVDTLLIYVVRNDGQPCK